MKSWSRGQLELVGGEGTLTSWMLGSQWSARPTRIIARHETASGSQGLAANQSSGVPGKPVETPARDPCRGSAHRLSSGQRGRRAGQAANALDAGCGADFRHVDEMLAWPCWRLQDKENLKTFSACLYPHCCLAAKQMRLSSAGQLRVIQPPSLCIAQTSPPCTA